MNFTNIINALNPMSLFSRYTKYGYSSNDVVCSRDQACTRAIMRRVRVIHYLRRLSSPLALEAALFIVFAAVITYSISIPHIIANISHLPHFGECVGYIITASLHTRLMVQIILGASLILVMFIVRSIYRNIKGTRIERIERIQTA